MRTSERPPRSHFTRSLLFFALANVVMVNSALIVLFSTPFKETTLHHTWNLLSAHVEYPDSWLPMIRAFDHVQSHPPDQRTPVYTKIFFKEKVKYQYPPTSLLVLYVLKIARLDESSWIDVLNLVSWILVVVMAVFVWRILELGLGRHVGQRTNRVYDADLIARGALVLGLTGTFYPAVFAYTVGQIQTWINCLFAVLFWYWLKENKRVSGVLAGMICLIKPQFSIVLLWGILRKQWRFVFPFAGTILAGILVSVSLMGVPDHINYLSLLSFLSKHGEAYYANQSVNGVLNRLLFNGVIVYFDPQNLAPFNPRVYAGTLISSVVLVSLALFWPTKESEKGSITDLSIIALTSTMVSPIAWEHHYGTLLPIYAYLLPRLLDRSIFGKLTIPFLAVSYFLTSNFFAVVNQLAYSPLHTWYTPVNILLSYLFAGALMVLACLYALRNAKPSEHRSS